MIRPTTLLVCLLLACAFPRAAAGDVAPRLSATALAERAAVVLTGRVAALLSDWDPATRVLFSYVTIDVSETLKGEPARRVVLKQIGGVTPTIGLHIEGQAAFRRGQDVLLFLATRRDGTLQTVALGQGKWALVPDLASGDLTAVREDGVPASAGLAADTLPSTVAIADVRRWAAAHDARVPYVAVPPERAAATLDPLALAAYEYLPTNGGPPARWHEADDGGEIPVDVGLGGLPAASDAAVDAATAAWSGAGSALRLARRGGLSGCAAAFAADGRIRVGSDSACGGGLVQDWVIGGGYYTQGDLRTVGGVTFQKFVAGFAVIDEAGPEATTAGCFQDAVTHGLGHAVGLGHSGGDAIMNAALPAACAGGPRPLGSDDVNAVRDIYRERPNSGQLPDAPTAVTVSVVGSTVTIGWTPATTGGVAQSYVVEAGTAAGVVNIGAIPSPGTGTSLVVNGVPQGVYWVQVRARNALGTSVAASSPTQVVVGPCETPGVPTAFVATGSDTLASFTWAPPSSGGGVQGYRLEVGSVPGAADLLVLPLPPAPTSFQANGPYGTYYVRLRATNACAAGPATPDVTLTLAPCVAPPAAPTNLTASVSPQRVVTLTWTPPATGAAPRDYVVYVGSAPGSADILVYGTNSASPALVASAPPRTYYVRVAARNACGQSGVTNEQVIQVP